MAARQRKATRNKLLGTARPYSDFERLFQNLVAADVSPRQFQMFAPTDVGAHMKSEVKTKLPRSESQMRFAFDFAGRPFEDLVTAGIGTAGLPASGVGGQVRGFTRPCASVNTLRHTWGTRDSLTLTLPGPGSSGSCRAGGPASYGNSCRHGPSRTSGSHPASRIRAAAGPQAPGDPAPR